jgi:pseudouridine synthase
LKVRINKFLRDAGLGSRRKVEELVAQGKVKVNRVLVRDLGTLVDPAKDIVEVNGKRIYGQAPKIYGILNKPFGVVSTMKDPEGRPCAGDLLRPLGSKVFLVGRLDFDTMGLLPFTNDGQWAHKLLHPRYHIPRTYKAIVEGQLSDRAVEALRKGVPLSDGPTQGAKVEVLQRQRERTVLRVTIYEGRNRQVRRMFEALGYRVLHLVRIGFGPLTLGDLKVGEFRILTDPPFVKKQD